VIFAKEDISSQVSCSASGGIFLQGKKEEEKAGDMAAKSKNLVKMRRHLS
jgi:hypothetical protein